MYLTTQLKSEDSYLFSLKMESGKSPLHKAVGSGHIEVVKLLLNKIDVSAEINSQDTKRGHTPLHVAALNGSPEIIEHLLAYGASTTITDKKGYTPFQVCYKHWTKSSSTDAVAVLLLMDRESKESLKDLTLLNTAAVKGSVPVLTKLLDRGATLNHPDEHGWTPLQLASQYGHSDAVKNETRADKNLKFTHYGHGDVMGCGVDFGTGELLFTRNGVKLPTAFKDVKGRLHPIVGMAQIASVEGNFGEDVVNHPFVWEKANLPSGGWMD